MRTFLAIVGLLALLGGTGWIGSRLGQDAAADVETEIDPFEGIELPYQHEKSIRITCSRQAPSKAGPSRDCVQRQAAALKEHQLMEAIYPNGSTGLAALKKCEARATDRSRWTVDFVQLVDCANRKLGNIEAGRLGNVKFID